MAFRLQDVYKRIIAVGWGGGIYIVTKWTLAPATSGTPGNATADPGVSVQFPPPIEAFGVDFGLTMGPPGSPSPENRSYAGNAVIRLRNTPADFTFKYGVGGIILVADSVGLPIVGSSAVQSTLYLFDSSHVFDATNTTYGLAKMTPSGPVPPVPSFSVNINGALSPDAAWNNFSFGEFDVHVNKTTMTLGVTGPNYP